jgi:DNA-directed RNA polymerase subunit M/transcription elongation factor TFIIS
MMWLKSCPRCRGDLYSEKDLYGINLKCLQCGHVLTEAQKQLLRLQAESVSRSGAGAPDAPQGERQAA